MVQITKQEVFDAITSMFEFAEYGKHEDGKSFYHKKNNDNVTFMFDKRQYPRFEVLQKLTEYFRDKNIINGQLRVDSITMVWTAVYLENRKGE